MQQIDLDNFTSILAKIGAMLISNGANSNRTARNLNRIAKAYGYTIEEFFSHSAVVLTVESPGTGEKRTLVKSIPGYHVNYSIISELSILSWELVQNQMSLEQLEAELDDISHMDSYPEWVKFSFIGIATASLAMIFGGTYIEFIIAFFAALIGIYVRKFILKKKYNINISWLAAAFVSTSVVNLCRIFGLEDFHGALTACVLWLIPGVPLINGSLDVLGSHVVAGWAKLSMGFMLLFMVAVGFYLSIFIFGYAYIL
ncbi:MAG: threonine/serine exporter ThrE family protein [Flavobacteriaceae bacterium]